MSSLGMGVPQEVGPRNLKKGTLQQISRNRHFWRAAIFGGRPFCGRSPRQPPRQGTERRDLDAERKEKPILPVTEP